VEDVYEHFNADLSVFVHVHNCVGTQCAFGRYLQNPKVTNFDSLTNLMSRGWQEKLYCFKSFAMIIAFLLLDPSFEPND
jgi:hypothetical protein